MLHVAVVDDDVQPIRLDLRGVLPDDVDETIGGLLHRHDDIGGLEILAGKTPGELIQLVQGRRRLTRRRASGQDASHFVLNVVERRAILSARPDVREPLGSFAEAPSQGLARRHR